MNRLFYETGAGDGFGPSISDLNNPDYKPPVIPPAGETEEQKTTRIAAEATATAQTELAKEATNTDGTLKPGYLKDAAGVITKDEDYDPNTVAETGLNEDGSLKEGFKKGADGKVIVDPDYKPVVEDFFAVVNKITGRELEVDYPEGMDPVSPEGVALREEAIRDKSFEEFEDHLMKNDPRGYAYLLHRRAGGTDEEFMNSSTALVLPTLEELKASADQQSMVYKYDLRASGLDEDTIEAVVAKAIKDNKLLEKATVSFTKVDTAQKKQLEDAVKFTEQENKQYTEAVDAMVNNITKAIETEMGFLVPTAQKAEFQKFVTSTMRYENGKFFIVSPVTDLKTTLDGIFFNYIKGDTAKLVARQAKTKAAQTLRLGLKSDKLVPGSKEGDNQTVNRLTLGEITKQRL